MEMTRQNLFNALQNVCGFTALESDMQEIIDAYEKDKAEQTNSPMPEPLSEQEQSFGSLYESKYRALTLMETVTPNLTGKVGMVDFSEQGRLDLKKWLAENKDKYDDLVKRLGQ